MKRLLSQAQLKREQLLQEAQEMRDQVDAEAQQIRAEARRARDAALEKGWQGDLVRPLKRSTRSLTSSVTTWFLIASGSVTSR
ncbi:hypothetical protein CKJ81_00115 [Corynebacterium hadale]|uniref:Uncharacterized protein n=1 Tax=Corynebacterium hadale TaxID=2026255 RepID=A0ABX4HC37_9CORY|nr:hypothetical protein CKJ81_00115 [Corynebacterium hadale]